MAVDRSDDLVGSSTRSPGPARLPADLIRCRSVLMLGTSLHGHDRIAATVRGYIDAGLFDCFDIRYVATHREGDAWRRLRGAVGGWMRFVLELLRMDQPLVHVHFCSRASVRRYAAHCALARGTGRPYMVRVLDADLPRFYDEECSAAERRFAALILRHASLVTVASETDRKRLLRICPAARVTVLAGANDSSHPPDTLIEHLGRLYQHFGILMRTSIR